NTTISIFFQFFNPSQKSFGDNNKIDDKDILTPPEDKELHAPTVQFFSYLPLAFHVQNGFFAPASPLYQIRNHLEHQFYKSHLDHVFLLF
ncbi:TPA: hypothetical protein ACO35W_004475, partial [Salmonella enterica subsp. enterica serovar Strathcona]